MGTKRRLKGIQKITPRKQKIILGSIPWRMGGAYGNMRVSSVYKSNA